MNGANGFFVRKFGSAYLLAPNDGVSVADPSVIVLSSSVDLMKYLEDYDKPPTMVKLFAIGQQKIQAIKVVREFSGLGLKEAKDLVEASMPQIVPNVSGSSLAACVAALQACGCQAEVVSG